MKKFRIVREVKKNGVTTEKGTVRTHSTLDEAVKHLKKLHFLAVERMKKGIFDKVTDGEKQFRTCDLEKVMIFTIK